MIRIGRTAMVVIFLSMVVIFLPMIIGIRILTRSILCLFIDVFEFDCSSLSGFDCRIAFGHALVFDKFVTLDIAVGLNYGVLTGCNVLKGLGVCSVFSLDEAAVFEGQLDFCLGNVSVLVQPLAVFGLDLECQCSFELGLSDVSNDGLDQLKSSCLRYILRKYGFLMKNNIYF